MPVVVLLTSPVHTEISATATIFFISSFKQAYMFQIIVSQQGSPSHCSHLLLKCRVATNIHHWLKVLSRRFKNYIFAKKCILISFWIFQCCFYYSFTLYYCAIFFLFGCWVFQYHQCFKQFGSRSGPTKCLA